MVQRLVNTTSTERLVTRLSAEGWVEYPGPGVSALIPSCLLELRTFVLRRLYQEGKPMRKADLQLATLMFSIRDHEFQVHPDLEEILQQLTEEGLVKLQLTQQGRLTEPMVLLTSARRSV